MKKSYIYHSIDHMDPVEVYRIFYPNSAQHTFFPGAHGTFFKVGHILEHKANLSKYKKI
jgi:hypothetical protein